MDSAVTQRIVEGCTGVDLQLPALNLEPHAAERRRAKKAGRPAGENGQDGRRWASSRRSLRVSLDENDLRHEVFSIRMRNTVWIVDAPVA